MFQGFKMDQLVFVSFLPGVYRIRQLGKQAAGIVALHDSGECHIVQLGDMTPCY